MIQSHVDHSRRHGCESDSLPGDEVEESSRLELFDYDVSSAHTCGGIRYAPTVAMKLRERVQIDVALVYLKLADRVHSVEVEVAVRQHHAFWLARSARRVEQC